MGAWLSATNKSYDLAITHDRTEACGRLHHFTYMMDSREDVLRAADILRDADIPQGKHVDELRHQRISIPELRSDPCVDNGFGRRAGEPFATPLPVHHNVGPPSLSLAIPVRVPSMSTTVGSTARRSRERTEILGNREERGPVSPHPGVPYWQGRRDSCLLARAERRGRVA